MELSLQLRVGAIFLIFIVSLLGFFSPLVVAHYYAIEDLQKNSNFLILKSFSTGIILGVAVIHLLGEAASELGEYYDYPLAYALASVGVLLTLGVDQVSMFLIQRENKRKSISSQQGDSFQPGHSNGNIETESPSSSDQQHLQQIIPTSPETHHVETGVKKVQTFQVAQGEKLMELHAVYPSSASSSSNHTHSHAHNMLMISDHDINRAVTKSLVLEISIAIHSIIIGVSFGILGPDDIQTIRGLMVALSFHQFFEGVSLGGAIAESKLNAYYMCCFAFSFAFSWCIGGVIGISTGQHASTTEDIVKGCFSSIAAGSLIYSALVEMIAEDFSSAELINQSLLKAKMFLASFLGLFFMAFLALYA